MMIMKLRTPSPPPPQPQYSAIKRPVTKRIDIEDTANIILFLAAFLGIWQLIFMLEIWPKVSLPSPLTVAQSFLNLIGDYSLIYGIAVTMWRLLVGFSISIAIGAAIGLAMVKFNGFGKTMSSFAVGLQSFPSIAWVPFAILLIGLNDFGILFVVIMSSVFSVMISTYSGIRNISPIYMRAARNMGARGVSLFRHVMLPAAYSIINYRNKTSLVFCLACIDRSRDVDNNIGRFRTYFICGKGISTYGTDYSNNDNNLCNWTFV